MPDTDENTAPAACPKCAKRVSPAETTCPACGLALASVLASPEKPPATKAATGNDKELQLLGVGIIVLGAIVFALGYTHTAAWCFVIGGITFIGARVRAWLRQF